MEKLVVLAFVSILVTCQAIQKLNREESLLIKQRMEKMVEGVTLPQSPFLCEGARGNEGASPSNYMSSPLVNKSNFHQVALGLVVENYSRFKLKLLSSDFQDCAATRAVRDATDVASNRLELLIWDNSGGKASRSVCGSISWQIMQANGAPYKIQDEGRRLVLTYSVPYKGKCNSVERNSFAISMDPMSLAANGSWMHADKSNLDYGFYHNQRPKKSSHIFASSGEIVVATFQEQTFFVLSSIDANCLALLRFKIFHNLDDYTEQDIANLKDLTQCGKDNVTLPKMPGKLVAAPTNTPLHLIKTTTLNTIIEDNLKSSSLTMEKEETKAGMTLATQFLIWFGAALLALLLILSLITLLSIVARKRRRNHKNRRFDSS